MSSHPAASAAPGTPQTSTKASVGAAVSALATAVAVAIAAYLTGTDEIDTAGILSALGAGIGNGLLTYLAVFNSRNTPTGAGGHVAPPG